MKTKKITTRTATPADLDDIMTVEKSFSDDPQYHASPAKMLSRIEKFAQGFFLTYVNDRLAYTITTCCVHYDANDLSNFSTWDHITDNGYLHQPQPPVGSNALYIVSGVVAHEFREANLFGKPYSKLLALAQQLQLDYIIAGATLYSYGKFAQTHPQISAAEYALMRQGSRFIDPLMEKYRRINFHIPSPEHIRPNYFADKDSLGHSVIVVHNIHHDAPRNRQHDKN